jgi:hypothetical protein
VRNVLDLDEGREGLGTEGFVEGLEELFFRRGEDVFAEILKEGNVVYYSHLKCEL